MQIGISTGDTHGVSRADSTPGHGDTPRTGQGGDGTPDAPTTPKKDTPAGDALGGDKQPHSGKHAADTPTTHADEAADTSKAGHGSGDTHDSGKVDADAQRGHDSAEHADADPNYDSLPDSSINQSEGFPEGVEPYTTPPDAPPASGGTGGLARIREERTPTRRKGMAHGQVRLR